MNLKNIYILILCITPLIGFCQAKPQNMSLGIGPVVPKKTNAIIRNFSTDIEIASKSKIIIRVKMTKTILDQEGKQKSLINWYYNGFSKYILGNVWVYDTLGNILHKKRLSQMQDEGMSGLVSFFDDLRMIYYNPHLKAFPYTIQYEYTKVINSFFQLPQWVPQPYSNTYVEKASLNIVNSSNLKYRFFTENFPDSSIIMLKEGENISWKVNNLEPVDIESFTYKGSDQLPRIKLQLESFEMEGFQGEFKDWKSFGQWNYDLNKGRQELPAETINYMRALTDTIDSDYEKAEAIYKWVQNQTRYVSVQLGIGGWQSFTAREVDEKKYGDCKALSNYTKALLNSCNIEAYYCIVNAGSRENAINPNELSNKFNHVILCLPLSGDTTWLECTSDDTPFGYISNFTDDRYALLVKNHESKLVKTTIYHLDDNVLLRKSIVQISNEGGMLANLQAVYHNLFTENRRFQLNEALPDQKDNLYDLVHINGFHIDKLSYQFCEDSHPVITERVDFTVRKIAATTSTRMFFPIFYLNKKRKKLSKNADRKNDIILRRSFTYIDTIEYTLPSGYQVQSLPKEKSIISDFGTYQTKIKQKGNNIMFVRKEEKYKGIFKAKRYEEFAAYKNSIIKADKASLVLKKEE